MTSRLVILSEGAFERLKQQLRATPYFEPDPGGDQMMQLDNEIVNDVKLAIAVEGDPGDLYIKIRSEVDV